ncbi:unnamed protein product [Protopolystoma xenopodis]|uniref:Uncharacterized protein n=1 Tax=Protopolystoma xenopodis TaxID=117903 RepID=A0A448WJ03_9PLAT|nr:unnamed protein product [Protopolystoma xenopodis]
MKLLRKQRQHECSSKANRQLVKRNPPSSSGGTELRISSPHSFTRNGSKLNSSFYTDLSIYSLPSYPTPAQSQLLTRQNVCPFVASSDQLLTPNPFAFDRLIPLGPPIRISFMIE